MTCQECVEFLDDYREGGLDPDVREEFERHLAVCPPCVAYLQNYEATVRLGRASCRQLDEPAAAALPEELVRAILAARGRS